ncbi:lactonase family protein [Paenibacillus motobuensis]|uniref:lactonase family protein n=1 Tax=Paenibacillus TaxID=44249 RepID=UPI00203E69C6|nr:MULTISPECIES: lactonase family protein [Paenibacillus]MCM3042953.1 lactonase family protein [Paenibacillus lutimineralis]MCM3650057.1 lactonase family protein [Paenibacillus motobuensis]
MTQFGLKDEIPFYVGTYAKPEEPGIYLCGLNSQTGAMRIVSHFSGILNPSFVIVNGEASRLYAVSEQAEGRLVSYRIDIASGELTELDSVPTEGADPCHLASLPNGDVIVSNYSSGTVNRFALGEQGEASRMAAKVQQVGTGPVTDRQEKAHAHSTVTDLEGKYAFASDLGADRIFIYSMQDGGMVHHDEVSLPPGVGPRHFVLHPNDQYAYGINELNNTITIYSYNKAEGRLDIIDHVVTIPEDFTGESYPADIHLSEDGCYLYGSNRGHDSIVRFEIDTVTGKLVDPEWTSTGGSWPRNFAVLDDYVLVANQFSGNIVSFKRDVNSGKLTATGQELAISQAACVEPVLE